MRKTLLFSAVAMVLSVMSPALAKAETIQASEVTNSGCKGSGYFLADSKTRAEGDSDVSWSLSYENGVLTLTWHNFVANCCPNGFISNIEVEDGTIVFDVREDGDGMCDCICLFDITSTYHNVTPGHYKLYFGDEMVGEVDIDEGFRQDFKQVGANVSEVNGGNSSLVFENGKVIARSPGKFRIDVYNVSGTRMSTLEGSDLMEISTLSGGVSVVRLTTEDGRTVTVSVAR